MNDFFPLFTRSAVVALEAAGLTIAVYDNVRHPRLNERGFATVLSMELVKQDETVYNEVSNRRIDNPRLEKTLFRALVVSEVIVACALWAAALALLLSSLGFLSHHLAQAIAYMAVLGFTAIFASLLIGGQWFWYRIGMAPALQAHFFLILWGRLR